MQVYVRLRPYRYLNEIKEPMDLGTIEKKVDSKRYRTMGQLARDVELVLAKWV